LGTGQHQSIWPCRKGMGFGEDLLEVRRSGVKGRKHDRPDYVGGKFIERGGGGTKTRKKVSSRVRGHSSWGEEELQRTVRGGTKKAWYKPGQSGKPDAEQQIKINRKGAARCLVLLPEAKKACREEGASVGGRQRETGNRYARFKS